MPLDALETLRQVNIYLRSALIRLRPEIRHCSTIKPRDFSDLLSQIRRASACLQRLPPYSEAAAAAEKESLEYRSSLEKLRHYLPGVHIRLLAEKSRLETARDHLAAAASWDRASKEAL
ncbi:MAG: hypothetical protein ABSD76_14935 [Terriglobales bacterium]|jgi:hypothetical protein